MLVTAADVVALADLALLCHPEQRLPGNLNMSFAYVQGESLLMSLKDIVALSSGSAWPVSC